ncbi:hypothetical protein DXT76_13565 [Halobacillus trueperi]|uniref:dUTPase n=1 Tax=Halobacillus trueperi TaxID=156205 RepID=A0A3D8VN93_9BACI|nr:dUTP diphosphatase [Halobacillus trueperi]RDY70298.1 hypothetical protein DXT76_13565 [Halobacillus trueperi]
MNLENLSEIQGGLDAHIVKEKGLEGQDLLPQKILALQVELGELANEWRGFKFWSKNQKPRIKKTCHACGGWGYLLNDEECVYCEATGFESRPLLEEYVDCLHFVLSLGNDLDIVSEDMTPRPKQVDDITQAFLWTNKRIADLHINVNEEYGNNQRYIWWKLYWQFIYLGKMLGLTEEEIEQAYLKKNEINHQRQLTGY